MTSRTTVVSRRARTARLGTTGDGADESGAPDTTAEDQVGLTRLRSSRSRRNASQRNDDESSGATGAPMDLDSGEQMTKAKRPPKPASTTPTSADAASKGAMRRVVC